MTNESNKTEKTKSKLKSRRALIKGAVKSSPIILAVANRPVLGGVCHPSGFFSGNLSKPDVSTCATGYSPGYWQTHPEAWISPAYLPGSCTAVDNTGTCKTWTGGTSFATAFGATQPGSNYEAPVSMMEVIWMTGGEDPYQFGAHVVAHLLNAANVAGYPLSEVDVKDIANQILMNGFYTLSTGEIKTAPEMVQYFQGLQT